MTLTKGQKLTLIAALLLIIDQVVKILVKTHMQIGESIPVFGNWFQILFVENKGMAFGLEFGGVIGKYILTLLRLVLAGLILYYIRLQVKKDAPLSVLVGLTLIFVGAVGNIIDCLFYGLLFGESTLMSVAEFLPEGGGYAPLLQGRVVDMLYFPLIDTTLPDWFPIHAGEHFVFFRPIFNIADSCITVGALYLVIFKWKFFSKESDSHK